MTYYASKSQQDVEKRRLDIEKHAFYLNHGLQEFDVIFLGPFHKGIDQSLIEAGPTKT